MKICPKCGTEVGDNLEFCFGCGLVFAENEEKPKKVKHEKKKKSSKAIIIVSAVIGVIAIAGAVVLGVYYSKQPKPIKTTYEAVKEKSVGDTLEYGSYPQSRVIDESVVSVLDGLEKDWKDYDFGDEDEYTEKGCMMYADIEYNGEKYRAVILNKYKSESGKSFTLSSEDSYQDDNGYIIGDTYYFKYEPIVWRIIDNEKGLVRSDRILDTKAYNNNYYINPKNGKCYSSSSSKKHYANEWETSTLRKWLNDDFYNTAFDSAERERILKAEVQELVNKDSEMFAELGENHTDDRIFLLAENEYALAVADKSIFPYKDRHLQITGTDYALCLGLRSENENQWFWLYSPYGTGADTGVCLSINEEGHYNEEKLRCDTFCQWLGVVPLFYFN